MSQNTKSITVHLDPELIQKIHDLSKKNGRLIKAVIAEILNDYFNKINENNYEKI